MLFVVHCADAPWLSLVVRAATEDAAVELGARTAAQYVGAGALVEAELIDPDGPEAVIVEDAS